MQKQYPRDFSECLAIFFPRKFAAKPNIDSDLSQAVGRVNMNAAHFEQPRETKHMGNVPGPGVIPLPTFLNVYDKERIDGAFSGANK